MSAGLGLAVSSTQQFSPPVVVRRGAQQLASAFSNFRRSLHRFAQAPGSPLKREGVKNGYSLHLRSCRVRVPAALTTSPGLLPPGGGLALRFRVSMFDSATASFFGRTYTSARALAVADKGSGLVEADGEVFYILTTVRDALCLVVVEAVVVVHDAAGVALLELGAGWCKLNLFAPGRAVPDVADPGARAEHPSDVPLFAGSPRALLVSQPGTSFALVQQCGFLYHFHRHAALQAVQSLLADDEVFGSYDTVPGLALCAVPAEALLLPPLSPPLGVGQLRLPPVWLPCMGPADPALLGSPQAPTTAVAIGLVIRGLRVYLPPGFERKLLRVLTANREVELGVQANTIQSGGVRVVQRVLTVTLHNGHTAVQSCSVTVGEALYSAQQVPQGGSQYQQQQQVPAAPQLGGLALPGSSLLTPAPADDIIQLHGYTPHELMGVIVALEYVVGEPTAVALGLTHRSAPLLPPTKLTAPGAVAGTQQHGALVQQQQLSQQQPVPIGGGSAAEQLRHVLVAQHVYIPASPTDPGAPVSTSEPPRCLLVLANRGTTRDPQLHRSFTRSPWEIPLMAPNPGLRLSRGVALEASDEVEAVLAEPALHRGFGALNVVVGGTLAAQAEAAPEQQQLLPAEFPQALQNGLTQPPQAALTQLPQPQYPDQLQYPDSPQLQDLPPQQPLTPVGARKPPEQLPWQALDQQDPAAPIPQPYASPARPYEPLQDASRRSPVPSPQGFFDAPLETTYGDAQGRHARGGADSPDSFDGSLNTSVSSFQDQTAPSLQLLDPVSVVSAQQQQLALLQRQQQLAPPPPLESMLARVMGLSVHANPVVVPADIAAGLAQDALNASVSGVSDGRQQQSPGGLRVGQDLVAATMPSAAQAGAANRAAALARAVANSKPLQHTPAPPSAHPGAFGWPLSQEDRERLLRWGFTNVLRVRGDGSGAVLSPEDFVPRRAVNIALELSDPLPAYTITLQFAAVTLYPAVTGMKRAVKPAASHPRLRPKHPPLPSSTTDSGLEDDDAAAADYDDGNEHSPLGPLEPAHPRALYFTFQLYSAAAVRTQPALLLADAPSVAAAVAATDAEAAAAFPTFILACSAAPPAPPAFGDGASGADARAAANAASLLTVSIDVDPTAIAPHARRDFIEHLCDVPLYVEAWDADSLMPFGSALVHLGALLRQQRTSVASARQFELVSGTADMASGIPGAASGSGAGGTTAPVSGAADYSGGIGCWPGLVGAPVGRLQVVMLSVGHKGAGICDAAPATTAVPVSAATLSQWGLPAPQPPQPLPHGRAAVRVHARPLTSTDPHLAALVRSRGAGRQAGGGAPPRVPSAAAAAAPGLTDEGELRRSTIGAQALRDALDGPAAVAAVDDMRPGGSYGASEATRVSAADMDLIKAVFESGDALGLIDYRRFAEFVNDGAIHGPLDPRLQRLAYTDTTEEYSFSGNNSDRTLPQLQAALSAAWARTLAAVGRGAGGNDFTGDYGPAAHPDVTTIVEAVSRSFSQAATLAQKKAAAHRHHDFQSAAPGSSGGDDGDGLESAYLRGEAVVAASLRDGELTVGRLRHTLASAAGIQLTDSEFFMLLATAYGSADTPGRVVAQGAAGDRIELQVVSAAPFVDLIADSYSLWLHGSLVQGRGGNQGDDTRGGASRQQLRPELAILRGKVRRALTQVAYEAAGGGSEGQQRQLGDFPLLTLLQSADFGRSGRLDWPSFCRVLREDLRLQLDPPPDPTGPEFSDEQRTLVSRQLARSDAQQRAAALAGLATSQAQALSQADEATLEAARDDELALLRAYRESAKADVVRRRLQDAVTASVALFPRFGQAEFFEFSVTNPYAHEERFVIRVDDPTAVMRPAGAAPELRVVADPAEARALRTSLPRACPDAELPRAAQPPGAAATAAVPAASPEAYQLDTPQFRATGEVLLLPGERLTLPLVFLSMRSGLVPGDQCGLIVSASDAAAQSMQRMHQPATAPFSTASVSPDALQPRTIVVSVTSLHHGQTTALLRVAVNPRPFPVHRTLRFFHAENEYLRAALPAPPAAAGAPTSLQKYGGLDVPLMGGATVASAGGTSGPPGRYVHCPDADVVVTSHEAAGSRELVIRYRCGSFPSTGVFHVLLYDDPYCASLHACWRIVVHSLLRVDVNASLGQATSVDLLVRGGARGRRVALYASHPSELRFPAQRGEFSLLAGALNRVTVTAQPLASSGWSGAAGAGSGRTMFVHLVDADSRLLVAAWRILCTCAPAAVTRTYNVQCGVGAVTHKKIPYRNDWDAARTYALAVGGGSGGAVHVKDPHLSIQAHATGFIRLTVGPVWAVGAEDVLLFVNDAAGQNEETLLLRVLFK